MVLVKKNDNKLTTWDIHRKPVYLVETDYTLLAVQKTVILDEFDQNKNIFIFPSVILKM